MKKIAIITLYGEYNFGNKLQNYAMQTILENMGFQVETLVFTKRKINLKKIISKKWDKLKHLRIKNITRKVKKIWNIKQYKLNENTRKMVFEKFSSEHLKIKLINQEFSLSDLAKEYDYFVIGSDQVWNPDYIDDYNWNFATFASSSQRIVYAASIGQDKILKKDFAKFKQALHGIKYIAMREEQGKRILREQFNVESHVVLDPTLLLSQEDWVQLLSINKERKYSTGNFVLTYFLGGNTKIPKEKLLRLCNEGGLNHIDLTEYKDNKDYVSGPLEFLKNIRDANLVLTDSFHGTVFSILFRTPFVVFKRDNKSNGMYGRIQQLLATFGLINQEYDQMKQLGEYLNCDFSKVNEIQNRMKKDSIVYMEDAFKSE